MRIILIDTHTHTHTHTIARTHTHNCAGAAVIDAALEAMGLPDFLSHTGVQVSAETETETDRQRESE